MTNNPFEVFKKQGNSTNSVSHSTEISFIIGFDDYGAYLLIADAKQKVIEQPNYALFSGATRELVKQWVRIQEQNLYAVDWEKNNDRIYLRDHDYLMGLLRRSKQKVYLQGDEEALQFPEGAVSASLQLKVQEETRKVYALWKLGDIKWELPEAAKPITEQYLLIEHQLLQIPPMGEYSMYMGAFVTQTTLDDLGAFLSLFFSYLPHVPLNMEGWKVVKSEELQEAQPCLIFEKIDSDQSLYLRIAKALSFLPADFLNMYEVEYAAQVNSATQQITVYPLSYGAQAVSISAIEKLLKKHRKKADGNYFLTDDEVFIVEKELAGSFLLEELPGLLASYQVMGAEKLKDYKITTFTPKLSLNIGSGIDFLEGTAELDFQGEILTLGDVLKQFRDKRYVSLSDGTSVLINQEYIDKLSRVFRKKKKGKKDEIEISFFDLPLVENLMEERMTSQAFERSRKLFEGFNELKSSKKRLPKVEATLRPYQKDGVRWLLYLEEQGVAGCLADDMGLGKTLQTITLLSKSYPSEENSSLLIMPRSLLFNWEKEIERFSPLISTYTFYGNNRNWEEAKAHDLILTTYGLARNYVEEWMEEEFHYVILDESQNIKNLNSQAHKAVTLLKSKHRLALSGTPIENNLSELYSLFHFLSPAMFGDWSRFNREYFIPIQKSGSEEAMQDLRRKIYPFILRRLKKDVLQDLPPKVEQTVYVEMEEDHAKFYEQRRRFYHELVEKEVAIQGIDKAQFVIFQALNELRQIATIPEAKTEGKIASPKKEMLAGHLEEAFANGHKVLIFANFLAAVEEVGLLLESMGVDFVSMTGATRNRQELVKRFQEEPECQAFVMTLKTGGTGLNLTAADTVFIYDPWWNVAAESQAIDRAHRIGQQHSVTAYKLIVKDSIEEKILQLQSQKKELVNQLISADGAAIKSLSADDIDFILS